MDLAFNRLTQLAFGYWQAQVLFALAEHRVFDLLTGAPRSAGEIATERELDAGVIERVLDAGVALNLLTKSAGRYANGPSADRFLVAEAPEGLLHWVRVMGQWAPPWSRLPEVARSGVAGATAHTGGAAQRDFILGMHEFARRTAMALPAISGLDQPRHLVDVGGGAGTYAIGFCQAYPELRATLLDLPDVIDIALAEAEHAGVADRVTGRPVDYRVDSLGSDADVVLFSNVLHQESEDVVVDMLRRGVSALADPRTGRILVHGHFLNDDRTSPMFGTLHNISAVLLWGAGRSYTGTQMQELLRRAGLQPGELQPVPGSTTQVLVGVAQTDAVPR
jgi:hypothetical protein